MFARRHTISTALVWNYDGGGVGGCSLPRHRRLTNPLTHRSIIKHHLLGSSTGTITILEQVNGGLDLALAAIVSQNILLHLLVLVNDEVLHFASESLQLINEARILGTN